MFSIQALYKGNFEIIFYADNPYTNNEEDYLRLSVWSFRGKTKSVLNNYLRDMTTNYKTSFLLPHDYEIPTFNYPQYVLPPIPYNYQPYTKDIWYANTIQPLKTKITAPAQCKAKNTPGYYVNIFDDTAEYTGYYETEIDLRQIDPTIQSIEKFKSAYKTIEISNLGNLQVECWQANIENFIPNRNVDLSYGANGCFASWGSLSNITLQKEGISQTDNVNFPNTFTIDTKKITNDIQTFEPIAYTNGLPSGDYPNRYITEKNQGQLIFLLQITKLSDNDDNKIKETYLQAYYTNDVKLKIRFKKVLIANLSAFRTNYFGNDKDITIDVSNPNVLGIRNKSDNPVKITIKPR
uniref:Protein p123 n-terminal truncated n=1 Tax=Spiroplasma citri TaxID=2133 RepID=Q14N27_SPICI|nr:protein p123 n-terminal truncated [Spiroplasma citri]